MLLAYADVRYEDKRYSLKDEAAINEWITKDKVQLMGTLDFPNLPYYIDGMVQMSQVGYPFNDSKYFKCYHNFLINAFYVNYRAVLFYNTLERSTV